ncbi:MAG: S-layer homology domain-containing protein, partial [Candidatus Gracilibacteria bacterium]
TGLQIAGGEMNFSDTKKGQWYEKYVAFASSHAIISGYTNGNFGPANSITRAELAKIAMLSLELKEK